MSTVEFLQAVAPGDGVEKELTNFFYRQPLENSRTRTSWRRVVPCTGVTPTTTLISFKLDPQQFPHCYDISNLLLSVKIRIVNAKTEQLPLKDSHVTGINNMLHSLFEKCCLSINGDIITTTPELYYLKAYLENLMTYGADAKEGWLMSSGYAEDNAGGGDWSSSQGFGYQVRFDLLANFLNYFFYVHKKVLNSLCLLDPRWFFPERV